MLKKLLSALLAFTVFLPAVSGTYYYAQKEVEFTISNNTLVVGSTTEPISYFQTFENYTVINTYTIIPFLASTTFIVNGYPATPLVKTVIKYYTWEDYGGTPHSLLQEDITITYIAENPSTITVAVNGVSKLIDRYFAYPYEPPNIILAGYTHTTRIYTYSSTWILWKLYGTYSVPQFGGPYWNKPTVHTITATYRSFFKTLFSQWTFNQPGYYYGYGTYQSTFTQHLTINETSYTEYQYTRNYHYWCIVGCAGGSYTYWKTYLGTVVIITTKTTLSFSTTKTTRYTYYRWLGTSTTIIFTTYNSTSTGIVHTIIIREATKTTKTDQQQKNMDILRDVLHK